MSTFDLNGRVIAITGANSGIGQALALGLSQTGARVICLSRSEPTETQKMIAELGAEMLWQPTQFESVASVRECFAAAEQQSGGIDVLINNAGTIRRAAALEFTEADWDEVMNLNLKAAFFLSQCFAQSFHQRNSEKPLPYQGKILQIASLLSFQGGIRVASYTASKSGLLGLTRLLANEWAQLGINVNAIAPGYIETLNTEPLRADAARSKDILARIPVGRWGKGSDLVGAAAYLCSSASDYVHGAVLPVDGGWLAR